MTAWGHLAFCNFYPRSPRGERPSGGGTGAGIIQFLSTLPAWGATARPARSSLPRWNFYPRSPRGERRLADLENQNTNYFYPRSPRGERLMGTAPSATELIFLSTLPAWGATVDYAIDRDAWRISIHAPRVGSDHL